MASLNWADGKEVEPYRAFVCQTLNPYSYPAKDRSGRLDCIEEPHLGKLMDKIKRKARPTPQRLTYANSQPIPKGE
jgi:hypothetical protein